MDGSLISANQSYALERKRNRVAWWKNVIAAKPMIWTPEKVKQYWEIRFLQDIPFKVTHKFSDGPKAQHDLIAELIHSHFKQGKVLDVGCGAGYLIGKLKRMGFEVSGCDLSEQVKGIIEDEFEFRVGSFGSLPFKTGMFDVVVAVDVIEHVSLDEFNKGLQECYRVLRPGGMVVFGTDNGEVFAANMQLCPECLTMYHPCQHLTAWTEETLLNALSTIFCRVTMVEHRMHNHPLPWLETNIDLRKQWLPYWMLVVPFLRLFVYDSLNKLVGYGFKPEVVD
jgi:2-polyprenyl-3-methyl-5-hydroxy-6-metoxy-1,4-benzoquinol methylase